MVPRAPRRSPRSTPRARKGRFDDEPVRPSRHRSPVAWDATDTPDPAGPSPSSWPGAHHGPDPLPSWLVTDAAATDADLGTLKTGKEADVSLLERAVPGGPSCLLAAKRYRSPEHRLFHRDDGCTEGRRVRRSREMRAMAHRTEFGRDLLAGQWAAAEFAALTRLTGLGAPVSHPVQLLDVLALLADEGLAHGDLSPCNLLVHRGDLVVIDLPQVVDVVSNPRGPEIWRRDVSVV